MAVWQIRIEHTPYWEKPWAAVSQFRHGALCERRVIKTFQTSGEGIAWLRTKSDGLGVFGFLGELEPPQHKSDCNAALDGLVGLHEEREE